MAIDAVRFGIHTGTQFASWDEIVKAWQRAEDLGYDTAWTYDHFTAVMMDPLTPCLEAWSCLAALAVHTKRIRFGTLATGNTYRHPAVLAKIATTVDVISDGRLEFGLGAGWYEPEHTMFGLPYGSARSRCERLDEALGVIRALWSQERASLDGAHYRVTDAVAEPKPVQQPHPPITIAAVGERRMLPIVARHADSWSSFGSPEVFGRKIEILKRLAADEGRSADDIEKAILCPVVVSDDLEPFSFMIQGWAAYQGVPEREGLSWMLAGTADAVCRQIDGFLAAGVTHFVALLTPFNFDALERLASDVMPRYR